MKDKFQILRGTPVVNETIFVDWDECGVGEEKDIIRTDSVGPCLAITLYDRISKKGILTHITGDDFYREGLSPENVINTLLKKMNKNSKIKSGCLEISLAGEDMDFSSGFKSGLVKEKIEHYKIPILGGDLGPSYGCGRQVVLYCDTGSVEVYRMIPLMLR
ncbi:MAG: hypothetical protein KKG60_00440 [Nanoarchaeota archaeon]|nr:hypothetical protein [Nanoarchaeota archaeon]